MIIPVFRLAPCAPLAEIEDMNRAPDREIETRVSREEANDDVFVRRRSFVIPQRCSKLRLYSSSSIRIQSKGTIFTDRIINNFSLSPG